MPSFQDKTGHAWSVELDLAAAYRIDDADFSALYDKPFSILEPPKDFFTDLITRPRLIYAMIWCIVFPQAERLGIDQEAFCARLGGESLTQAKEAFWDAVADFFPELRSTLWELFSAYKAKTRKADELLAKTAKTAWPAAMDRLIEATVQEVEREIAALGQGGPK